MVRRIMDTLREKEITGVRVVGNGIMPDEDAGSLNLQPGAAAEVRSDASFEEAVESIRSAVAQYA